MPATPTIRRGLTAALLVLPVLLAPTRSAAQRLQPPQHRHPPGVGFPSTADAPRAPRALPGPSRVSLAEIKESEPNDSFRDATLVSLGDTISAVLNPGGDVDWYALDLTAGATIQFELDGRVAFEAGGVPLLWLYYEDGANGLVELWYTYNDQQQAGGPTTYWISIPAAGRYYLAVADFFGSGSALWSYTLRTTPIPTPPPGPGEPVTLFATGVSAPYGMAAAGNGDILVADAGLQSILRVDLAGRVTAYAAGISQPWDVVVDGLGDVLVADPSVGVIRITPTGARSIFAPNFTAVSVTVDQEGDVWVGGSSDQGLEIRRYDPTGILLSTIPFLEEEGGALVASGIAVSPTGDVYTHNGYNGIYRVTGGTPTRMLTTPVFCLWDLAFDADGYLYVTSCTGKVMLYDPAFQPVATPFARIAAGPLVFGRDATGRMTSRLFVAVQTFSTLPPFVSGIVELNPAAMRAPGLRVGVDLLRMATTTLRPGFVDVPYADTLRLTEAPGPVVWSIAHGSLPAGITLDSTTGVLSGRPVRWGAAPFTVRGRSGGRVGTGLFAVSVTTIGVPAATAAKALLGESGAVSPEEAHLLDLLGNGNGRFDVADFRAYLKSLHILAAPAGTAQP